LHWRDPQQDSGGQIGAVFQVARGHKAILCGERSISVRWRTLFSLPHKKASAQLDLSLPQAYSSIYSMKKCCSWRQKHKRICNRNPIEEAQKNETDHFLSLIFESRRIRWQ
jgi:hypothetical protein